MLCVNILKRENGVVKMKQIYKNSLICFLILALITGCSEKNMNAAKETDISKNYAVENINTDETIKTYKIETEVFDMKYPKRWENKVSIEQSNNCISFVADETHLFDIMFNSDEGEVLGTIKKKDANIVLSVKMYELDVENKNFDDYTIMQEDINIILDNLEKDYNFVVGSAINFESRELFEITTKHVTLYYPIKWKEKININTNKDVIRFSSNGIDLFSILFNSSEGNLLGTYNGINVTVIFNDIEQNDLSDSEYLEYVAMQEDLNVILEKLCEDEKFTVNIG